MIPPCWTGRALRPVFFLSSAPFASTCLEATPQDQHTATEFAKHIDVKDVTFRYDTVNPMVLNSVSLNIKRGEKIAFVGPSGSGKSTLIDIMVGLFSPLSGQVLIDDAPLDDHNKASWRAGVGYVPQVVYLYDDTIARNIAFGQPKIDEDRLRQACDWAQLGSLLNKLPEGLDTMLGERGVRHPDRQSVRHVRPTSE